MILEKLEAADLRGREMGRAPKKGRESLRLLLVSVLPKYAVQSETCGREQKLQQPNSV